MKEPPAPCPGCSRWVLVEGGKIVQHETPGRPRTKQEGKKWKRHGRPVCPGSGRVAVGSGDAVRDFLESMYRENSEKTPRACCRSILKAFDKEFIWQHSQCQKICEQVELDRLNTHQTLALLTATLPLRGCERHESDATAAAGRARSDLARAAAKHLSTTESNWPELVAGLI